LLIDVPLRRKILSHLGGILLGLSCPVVSVALLARLWLGAAKRRRHRSSGLFEIELDRRGRFIGRFERDGRLDRLWRFRRDGLGDGGLSGRFVDRIEVKVSATRAFEEFGLVLPAGCDLPGQGDGLARVDFDNWMREERPQEGITSKSFADLIPVLQLVSELPAPEQFAIVEVTRGYKASSLDDRNDRPASQDACRQSAASGVDAEPSAVSMRRLWLHHCHWMSCQLAWLPLGCESKEKPPRWGRLRAGQGEGRSENTLYASRVPICLSP
jgi:hypothetical protein